MTDAAMPDTGEAAVRALIDRYVEGFVTADEGLLRSVFADDAVMNGYLGGVLIEGTPDPFITNTTSRPALADSGDSYPYEVEHLSVTGDAASAIVREPDFGPHSFVDHLHLLKRNGIWKIISKTFTTY